MNAGVAMSPYASAMGFLWDLQDGNVRGEVYILDVKMPHRNGFELAKTIRERDEDVPILFLTDFENEAVKGYDVRARKYLLKSHYQERLSEILPQLYSQ